MQTITFFLHFLCVAPVKVADLLSDCCNSNSVHLHVRVSQVHVCDIYVNAYVCPLSEGNIRQLIQQTSEK